MKKDVKNIKERMIDAEEINLKKQKIRKILFFKIGALGDVLMTTPLVREVRKIFPKAKLTYYVGKYAAPVLEGNKNVDRIETFDQDMFFKKNPFKVVALRSRIIKEHFDMAFVLDKHWIFGYFMKLCNIPVRIGFNRNGEGKYHTASIIYHQPQHEILYYISLLEALGIKPEYNTQLDLFVSKKDMAFAEKFFKDNKLRGTVVGVLVGGGGDNPGESGTIRRWSTHNYIELIHKLSKNYKVVLLGGPRDKELNENIIKFIKNKNVVNSAGRTAVHQSAALMKKCNVIVCHDSGPMHMAVAVNKKIVSLFGPTTPIRKAPLHKESIAIWHDQDIYEEGYELYGRLPDHSKKNKWMRGIAVNEVLNAVKTLLHAKK